MPKNSLIRKLRTRAKVHIVLTRGGEQHGGATVRRTSERL